MIDNFAENFMTTLEGDLTVEQMRIVLSKLQMYTTNFDIEEKCTDLMKPDDIIPYYYKTYIVSKKIEGMSPQSIITYDCNLKDFFYHINKPIEDVTTNDIRVYLYGVQKRRGITNRTLDGKRLILNSFFGWCYTEGYLSSNPVARVNKIKFIEKPREPLTDYEMEMIRNACKTTRERALIEMFYSTGCRVSEMERLKRSDIDLDSKEVLLFGKGSKYRVSYINAKAEFWLKKYWAEIDTIEELSDEAKQWCFLTSRRPYRQFKKTGMESAVHDIGERAGLETNLFPHRIRNSLATQSLRRGMPLPELQTLLGHVKPDTTLIYAKISQQNVKFDHQRFVC